MTLPQDTLTPVESLEELAALTKAAGAEVVGQIAQKRGRYNPACCVGRGKAEQIAKRVEETEADVVIFDNDLSPAQIRELEKIVECKVLDRSELILDIFASRAQTHEAKLQVDLAQLEYTYPRLTRMWSHLDTVTGGAAVGGVGTRGTGEKQLEIDRRLVKKRVAALKRQLSEIDQRKQREVRARKEHFLVSLVGYTNAGKSTLMNLATGSNTFVKDQLFATLDTKTARWQLGQDIYCLLSDTVGFVRDLPHHLVASFRATLEEALHADMLLHVVDASHRHAEQQMAAADQVLQEIGCGQTNTLLIFNKIDRAEPGRLDTLRTLYPDAICLSARTGAGVEDLVSTVRDRVTGQKVLLRVLCPYTDGRIASFLRAHGHVVDEQFEERGVVIEAYLGRRQIPGLHRLQPTHCEELTPAAY